MKIIIAAPAWPYRGGIAEFSNRLARQFGDEGHDVSIVTFTLQYPRFLFPGKTQFTDSPAPDDIRIRRLLNSINPLNWILAGRKLKHEKPDILLLRYWLPFMGPCLGTISRITRSNGHTKSICIFDNVVPHEKRPGDVAFTKYFAAGIDGGIVMASSVGEDLKKFRDNIPVMFNPHPVYDNYGPPVDRKSALARLGLPDARYILFFGFIRAYKGLDLLINALAGIRLRKLGVKLIVAGEFYEDDKPYRELVSINKLENDILFFDHFIKDDEVPMYFGSADLVVQPYKSATQSGVTQIAYHYGKPMLVTDVGGLKEIVPHGKCGYVVKPEVGEIADAISDFFENDRMEAFSRCVEEEKKRFSWERLTGTILECYKEALSVER
jgi:D-inositol-3-phosphate glycosyltransferase